MRRIAKIAFITVLILMTMWCNSAAKGKKIKVYLDTPDVGYNESFGLHLMEQMRLADEDDDSYEIHWVTNSNDAEFIVSIVTDRSKLPVIEQNSENHNNMCYQFILSLVLYKMVSIEMRDGEKVYSVRRTNPNKLHEMMNQQLNCDPDDMARRATDALLTGMRLREVNAKK